MKKTNVFVVIVIILLIAGGVSFFLYQQAQNKVIAQEKERVALQVRQAFRDTLIEKDFSSSTSAPSFEKFWQQLKVFNGRIKIWNTNEQIIWSNLSEIIGQKFTDNEELKEAYEGEIEYELVKEKSEHVAERSFVNANEMYVPLFNDQGKVFGVVELYYGESVLLKNTNKSLWTRVLPIMAGAILLCVMLWRWLKPKQQIQS